VHDQALRQTLRQSGLQRVAVQRVATAHRYDKPRGAKMKATATAPDHTIMTRDEVAAWLKVRPRQVERMGIPCIPLGRKTVRYVKEDIVAWLDQQRKVHR
jgi:hypothetical protein